MKALQTITIFLTILFAFFSRGYCQFVHAVSTEYEWPEDSLVLNKLKHWQDQKFGILLHWGLYSVPGIVESWSICSEEEDWIPRDSTLAYEDYKKWYWNLINHFNPRDFDPEQWAAAARDAGMRYAIFTTKHHDGFNMFYTHQTDFSITQGPFKDHPRADVAKYVFEAFRKEHLLVGAYFSKPDWHCEYYWWPRYATPNRHHNYDIKRNPWRWNRFKEFTYRQISELMHSYGSIDILWLDGGWVNSPRRHTEIDIPRIAAMARKAQPGLLIVDRTIHGKYENYRTPEQQIPDTQLPYPWESCITLTSDWGYKPHATFKSPTQIICKLAEIVAKGGSLLLGIGPDPQGRLPEEAVVRMRAMGEWLRQNGEAIYATTTTPHYHSGNIWFTANKEGNTCYAICCPDEKEQLPAYVEWEGNIPVKGSKIKWLPTGKNLKWVHRAGHTRVYLPHTIKTEVKVVALSFQTSKENIPEAEQ